MKKQKIIDLLNSIWIHWGTSDVKPVPNEEVQFSWRATQRDWSEFAENLVLILIDRSSDLLTKYDIVPLNKSFSKGKSWVIKIELLCKIPPQLNKKED